MDRFLISISSEPSHGKSTLVSVPHERLGKLHVLACEPPAFSLSGIPREWREHITIERLGWDGDKRFLGDEYYDAIISRAQEDIDADTIIIDTHTGVARNRLFDILQGQKGVYQTKFRSELEVAQTCAMQFLEYLEQFHPDKNIISLYHTKEIKKQQGQERLRDTYWPAMAGSTYDKSWAGKFQAVLAIDKTGEERNLYLKYHKDFKFAFIRKPFGVEVPECIAIEAEDEGPLIAAWDKVFEILDS